MQLIYILQVLYKLTFNLNNSIWRYMILQGDDYPKKVVIELIKKYIL